MNNGLVSDHLFESNSTCGVDEGGSNIEATAAFRVIRNFCDFLSVVFEINLRIKSALLVMAFV